MNKKILYFSLALFQIYHISYCGFNLGGLWSKTETETITKDYLVDDNCTITVHNTEGTITIKSWPHNKILIEATKKGSAENQKNTTIAAKAAGTQASIITRIAVNSKSSKVDYTLMVPENATLKITQTRGSVKIRGSNGFIDISLAEQGSIEVTDSCNTISATTNQGDITVQQKKLVEPHSIFLKSDRGNINLALPKETSALLHAKTVHGTINSDHPVTLAPITLKLNKDSWERLKKDVEATLGGVEGNTPVTLETSKGNITIKEY